MPLSVIATTSTWTVAAIVIALFGFISLLVASVVVAFGARARTLAVQQDQSINSLSGELAAANSRIADQASEIRELRGQLGEAKGAITALQKVPHEAIAALDRKVEAGFIELGVKPERLRLVQ